MGRVRLVRQISILFSKCDDSTGVYRNIYIYC